IDLGISAPAFKKGVVSGIGRTLPGPGIPCHASANRLRRVRGAYRRTGIRIVTPDIVQRCENSEIVTWLDQSAQASGDLIFVTKSIVEIGIVLASGDSASERKSGGHRHVDCRLGLEQAVIAYPQRSRDA